MDIKLENIIISILVLGTVITGFYWFMDNLASETGWETDVSDDLNYIGKYNKSVELGEELEQRYSAIQNTSIDKAAGFFTGVGDIFSIIKSMVVAPFSISSAVLGNLSADIGLPYWIGGLIIGLIVTALIFAVIYAVMKVKI